CVLASAASLACACAPGSWLHARGASGRSRKTGDPTEENAMAFTLPPLPYPADALEPSIDKMTMEIHHGRHHKAYVDNLNAALEGQPALATKPIVQLMKEINQAPEAIRQKVINNGGGHANHAMFWEIMGPKAGGEPKGTLADAIRSTFGDFAALKAKIKEAALG